MPVRNMRAPTMPAPNAIPYDRAIIAPVSSTQPIAKPDAQHRGEHPCARWDVTEPVGLAQIEQEQEREAQRLDRDERGGQPQQRERDQRYEHHRKP